MKLIKWLLISCATALACGFQAIALDDHKRLSSDEWYKAGAATVEARKQLSVNTNKAKNVILVIGDGMGISTLTAARILEGQMRGETGEENLLSFEKFPYTALVKTYNTDQQVPDSAGTASAMNTGVKTRSRVISLTPEQPKGICAGAGIASLNTLAMSLENMGYATGVVTTAKVTHATPAAVYANSAHRNWESDDKLTSEARDHGCKDIARQLIEFKQGDGLDVAFGGGRKHFLPKGKGAGTRNDNRDLTQEWLSTRNKASYVEDASALSRINSETTGPVLGLFAADHIDYVDKRPDDQPSLTSMTIKAIDILSKNEKGYYLMVEAGRVDHAHHEGNAYRALHEAVELSKTVAKIIETVDLSETLVLVTADHSHVFTLAGYPDRGNPILGVVRDQAGKEVLAKDGKPYTSLGYWAGPGHEEGERSEVDDKITQSSDYLQQAAVPLKKETHGGEDVALFAVGPWAHLVGGMIEQNVIYHYMVNAMGLKE